ncbi:adenosine deaminase [Acetobacteraceae bacterium]|nr:adenosine deaminase [Acetobacteraceae bacterium]
MRHFKAKHLFSFRALMLSAVFVSAFSTSFANAKHKNVSKGQAENLEEILASVKGNPVALEGFLKTFPKGSDLHNHLTGAIYAENFLRWAGEDGNCIAIDKQAILPTSCTSPAQKNLRPAKDILKNKDQEEKMVDAMSMRHFVYHPGGETGHDHFFAAFHRFDGLKDFRMGDMLAEATGRAAEDHVEYVEFMIAPTVMAAIHAGSKLPDSKEDGNTAFKFWEQALAPELPKLVAQAEKEINEAEKRSRKLLNCDAKNPQPACSVHVRYLYQALRTYSPKEVFAQLSLGYALAAKDSRVVGVDFAEPEDNEVAVKDYAQHMQMFAFLNKVYPSVKLSLHAGELSRDLVPKDALKNHIRQAIEVAGAKRIGHGVDIAGEENSDQLLKEMSDKGIMVEINLTSNDEILNVKGKAHPLALYQHANVPVALSTDDEGVSRGNLTQEYMRAVTDQNQHYEDLKNFSRTGLEKSFMPGKSLWVKKDKPVKQCQSSLKTGKLSKECTHFLEENEKARLQWELEEKFKAFEKKALQSKA